MPKRGQTLPFRLDYTWDPTSDKPVKGCVRFSDREEMEMFAAEQRSLAESQDRIIEHKFTDDTPASYDTMTPKGGAQQRGSDRGVAAFRGGEVKRGRLVATAAEAGQQAYPNDEELAFAYAEEFIVGYEAMQKSARRERSRRRA
jgi:hypothetical protein